jgi:hypothetical protein
MTVWGFTGGGHADPQLGMRLRSAGATHSFENYVVMQMHYDIIFAAQD